MPEQAPWWWKLCGLVLMATGIGLLFVPGRIVPAEPWVRLIFIASAVVFVAIGFAFLKTKPQSGVLRCAFCAIETKRDRLTYYCPGCGHALQPDEDGLDPSEINCAFCEEPVRKGAKVCPRCTKTLPGFGIESIKGRPCCRWCKTSLRNGEKFCRFCSAPL